MDKFDFIKKIAAMYPIQIKEGIGAQAYYDKYSNALKGLNVDYNKLFELFSLTYEDNYPPSGKTLKEMALKCIVNHECSGKWLHVAMYDPRFHTIRKNDCFPEGTTLDAMQKTYEKKFPDVKGWKIVEVF